MASVSRFAVLVPILIDEERNVLAGHGRLLAAIELGLTEVPTVRVTHLTDVEKRAYSLADNRLGELSYWDPEILKIELEALSVPGLDLDLKSPASTHLTSIKSLVREIFHPLKTILRMLCRHWMSLRAPSQGSVIAGLSAAIGSFVGMPVTRTPIPPC
jgi:hypothetical protein